MELLLKVGDSESPEGYRDGDIVCVFATDHILKEETMHDATTAESIHVTPFLKRRLKHPRHKALWL
tara:strand:+ start:65 stop:262 length:198 start_codon:yes stop_codon:yes gene_type:complete